MSVRTVQDQLGRTVRIGLLPERIVSLVPSQTELLFDLGLGDRVVGITKFCVHPEAWFRSKKRVGGTKDLNLAAIAALNPDLILANKEENNQADIEHLEKLFPTWVSDVKNLDTALEMIRAVADITGTDATTLCTTIATDFQQLKPLQPKRKTLYLIWKDPYMACGTDTFVNDMLLRCGFENVLTAARYPELTEEELIQLDPAVVLLSSEPFPFKEKHMAELQRLLPHAKILLADGEFFSWYGSRLQLAAGYFEGVVRG